MIVGTVLGAIAIVLVTVALGVALDRKLGLLPRADKLAAPPRPALPAEPAGEAPATAIRARAAQLDRLRTQRCRACRAPLTAAPDDHVRYDGHELIVLRFSCDACGARRAIYIHPI